MIILYSGIPGSGKSYKMVKDLIEEKGKRFIVHNIDGLKKDYLSENEGFNFLEYCEKMNMEVEDFFSKEYQIELTEAVRTKYGKNVLMVIDECHEWFDRNKKTLKMWLSYHRHLNQDIWLVAHRSTNLPAVYRSFIEVEYRAKFSTIFALPGFFMYNRIVGGESVGYKYARKKQEVFDLYKSMAQGYKKPSPSLVIPVVALFVIAGVSWFLLMPGKLQKSKNLAAASPGIPAASGSVSSFSNNQEFVFAGRLGDQYLLKEVASGRIFKIDDLSGKFIFFHASESELILFDTESLTKKSFKRMATFKPVEKESVLK